MSEGPDTLAKAPASRSWAPKVILVICAVLAMLIGGAGLLVRYGVLLPQVRLLVESQASGLKIGRMGRLEIEGLQGDLWKDLTIGRLAISDEKGLWLEARDIHLVWRSAALFGRRFEAESLTARQVRILRRPTLTPKQRDRGMPVSVRLDRLAARVEMLPAFSFRRGVYDLTASLDIQRGKGGRRGRVVARSALHPGDFLDASFQVGGNYRLMIAAKAAEAQGGALAGSLGLPADRPFGLSIQANGSQSQGRFVASTTSGAQVPLFAQGDWNAQGGQAAGRVSLTASTLTRAYVEKVGPEARFQVGGRRGEDDLYALDARIDAANLTATARGRGDIGQRRTGPAGIAVTLDTLSLSRLVGGPAKSAASVSGVLKGRADDLDFNGTLTAAGIEAGRYSLASVQGPLSLARNKKALTLDARLTGAGGAGQGLLAALLGARPTARIEASRFADGRLGLQNLEATGPGLKLEASGGRGLLGQLTFKGDAEFSNLAAARPGASGLLRAAWSASQAGVDRAWIFTVDGNGVRFATGYAELDRLLGASPKLGLRAGLDDGKVSVAQARLDGEALDAEGAGEMRADGSLGFKLGWNATGPFRAGPVEVTGKAQGDGAITGTLGSPRADLTADFDQIDLPRLPLKAAHLTLTFARRADGSSGVIALTADSEYGPARARSDFNFPQGGVDLTDLSLDAGGVQADGSLSLRRNTPSAADLRLTVGRGAFLDAGTLKGSVRIIDAAGGPRADLDLTAENVTPKGAAVSIRSGELTANGPLARLPYVIQANGSSRQGRWILNGRGQLDESEPGYALSYAGAGKLGARDLRTIEPAVFRFGGPTRSGRLRLAASDGGRIELDAELGEADADIRARVADLGLVMFNEDLDGDIDATLTLQGSGERLEGTLSATLSGARGRGSAAALGLDGAIEGRLSGDVITLQGEASNSQGLKANVNVTLPAEASAGPLRLAINRTRPISGRFFADGEIKPLWDLLMSGERTLAGRIQTSGTIGGTLADLTAEGTASVDDGRFVDGATGLTLERVVLRATFADAAVNVSQASGSDGHGGNLSGSGRISLLRNGVSSFRMDLTKFRLIDNNQATASATGGATIARNAEGRVRIAGALAIDEAEIAAEPPTPSNVVAMEVVERNKPAELGQVSEPTTARRGLAVALDVTLKAPRRVFLRGRGLDIELSLDAHVGGTTARPDLTGTARVVRGDYDFAGKRFEFDDRGVVYLSTRPENIRLNLTATRDDPTLTAVVQIRGTAARPEITLTSSPVLPNDEVLSQVLFGRSAAQLSALEAAQLASAISALAGGGGFDVVGNLRNFARLDRLSFGGDEAAGMTVAGGKYLTDDVYLELIGGGRDGGAAQVEWRIRKALSLVSRVGGQGDARLSVRWRRDY